MGTSDFCTEARDSPNVPRNFEAALPSAASTCSLLEASACCCARESPLWQLTAFKVRMYCVPRLAMDPESIALLPTRMHKSRVRSVVRRSSGERPMKVSVVWTRAGGTTRKNGDWSRSTASACFKGASNTGSPVVLAKSERTTVAFSVGGLGRRERRNNPPPMRPAISTAAATIGIVHDLFWTAGVGPLAGVIAPDEPAATAAAEGG